MAQIGHSPAERILRLCPTHYQGRQLNSARRTERAALICQYPACGISISETRNQFYCCKEHRDKARRLIDDDAIIRLVKHSYWLNVEAMLKNNSLGLGSITGPTDIADLIRLYPIGAFGLSSCKGCYACWIVKPFPITDIMWKRKYTKIIIALNGSYKREADLQIRAGSID
ncbi:hypothetical protein NGI08_25345 [Klebsiella michiganensis]|uniref:hypothetical protein n=1 Tax=Klebsiella michiganensis TaxID=1134687 RepID=UPI002DBA4FB9|nr:hypothetical protein [Klebsiella michiganensis]MEB8082097.1 hypothetical protein [Klebsiella michiganensis]